MDILHLQQVREARMKEPGPDHKDTLYTVSILASAYTARGKPAEAIALLLQVCDPIDKAYGPDHPVTLETLGALGGAYLLAGKTMEAIDLLSKVRDAHVKKHGRDNPYSLIPLTNLAPADQAAGELTKALPLFHEAAASVENRDFLHVGDGAIRGVNAVAVGSELNNSILTARAL